MREPPSHCSTTSVVIVGAGVLLREALAGLLAGDERVELIATAGDALAAAKILAARNPDVVLMDLSSDSGRGERGAHVLFRANPQSRVVALIDDGATASRLLSAGVSGCLTTNVCADELVTTLRAVVHDPCRVIVSLPRHQFSRLAPQGHTGLSNREDEILRLVAEGATNAEIADDLFISLGTVKRHLSNVYAKLRVRSRFDAAQVFDRLNGAAGEAPTGWGHSAVGPWSPGGSPPADVVLELP